MGNMGVSTNQQQPTSINLVERIFQQTIPHFRWTSACRTSGWCVRCCRTIPVWDTCCSSNRIRSSVSRWPWAMLAIRWARWVAARGPTCNPTRTRHRSTTQISILCKSVMGEYYILKDYYTTYYYVICLTFIHLRRACPYDSSYDIKFITHNFEGSNFVQKNRKEIIKLWNFHSLHINNLSLNNAVFFKLQHIQI